MDDTTLELYIDKDYFDVLYNKETNLVYIKHHPLIGAPFEQVKIIDTTDGRFFKAEFFGYQKINNEVNPIKLGKDFTLNNVTNGDYMICIGDITERGNWT